jgi:hypothetical protein
MGKGTRDRHFRRPPNTPAARRVVERLRAKARKFVQTPAWAGAAILFYRPQSGWIVLVRVINR